MSFLDLLPPGYIVLKWMVPSMLGSSWEEALREEFDKPYFVELNKFIAFERALGTPDPVYPPHEEVFAWSQHCRIEDVKVVIVGQDPSPKPGVACGLSFSSKYPNEPPKSTQNIFKEMECNIGFTPPEHGDLTKWAQQGVLLLNSHLTIRANDKAKTHRKIGWDEFTTAIIRCVNTRCAKVVFMLWGREAQEKRRFIDCNHHCVLEAYHPNHKNSDGEYPFLGCGHFSEAQGCLTRQGKSIKWSLA